MKALYIRGFTMGFFEAPRVFATGYLLSLQSSYREGLHEAPLYRDFAMGASHIACKAL